MLSIYVMSLFQTMRRKTVSPVIFLGFQHLNLRSQIWPKRMYRLSSQRKFNKDSESHPKKQMLFSHVGLRISSSRRQLSKERERMLSLFIMMV